jgi:hypothetical protein
VSERFFAKHELSIGQCPAWRIEEHELNGAPLPAFEPADDPYAGSHVLVEHLRNNLETFDEVGGYEPEKWEVVISNLYVLADLATAGAAHMRQRLDAEAAEEAAFQARMAEWRPTERSTT